MPVHVFHRIFLHKIPILEVGIRVEIILRILSKSHILN